MPHVTDWYRNEADYLRMKEICTDKKRFGDSYGQWIQIMQKKIDELKNQGIVLTKVYINPEAFLVWCEVNKRVPDGQARAEFAVRSQSKEKPKAN